MAKTQKPNKLPDLYRLRIYDNFPYMDEDEAYNHGQFDTYQEARKAAEQIVDDYFKNEYKPGMTLQQLQGSGYTMYGDKPVIVLPDGTYDSTFSAWAYAEKESPKKVWRKMRSQETVN